MTVRVAVYETYSRPGPLARCNLGAGALLSPISYKRIWPGATLNENGDDLSPVPHGVRVVVLEIVAWVVLAKYLRSI
jgi:hypothetical protein